MSTYRLFPCRLLRREQVSTSFVRITLGGDLAEVSDALGDQRVKLLLADADTLAGLAQAHDWYQAWREVPVPQPVLRTYTLSGVRPADDGSGEVDIDVVIHPDSLGPASQFAASAPVGSEVGLVAADRRAPDYREVGVGWHGGTARQVLLVGDETALPAIVNLLAQLAPDVTGDAWVEVPHRDDVREVVHPTGIRLRWFVRDEGQSALDAFPDAGCPPLDLAESEPLWAEGTGGDWYLWAAGESGWVRRIRAIAKTSGRPLAQMSLMGYWKRGISLG